MDFFSLLLFIPACFALNMAPGPNNLMAMSNAKYFGFRSAFFAGGGRLVAFMLMIALAATGLAAVLYSSQFLFFCLKVAGAAYLLWLAFQLWNSKEVSDNHSYRSSDKDVSRWKMARQEFLLAAGNPKAILIFTAFLPQFIDPTQEASGQFMLLGSVFLCLEWLAIAAYAVFGLYLRHWFAKPEMARIFNRSCAFFLAASGIALLFGRRA